MMGKVRAANVLHVFGGLPAEMRLLWIASPGESHDWLAEAFESDSAVRVHLTAVNDAARGLARMHEERFDAVLVADRLDFDGLAFVEGLRAGGSEDAIVILGEESERERTPLAFEVGADGYVCRATVATRTLLWVISRAVERQQLVREHRLLCQSRQQKLLAEHDEAERLLTQQRALIRELDRIHEQTEPLTALDEASSATTQTIARHADREAAISLPESLVTHYAELLQAYVMMGSGSLANEMRSLAEVLAQAEVSAAKALQLHLQAVENMVRGLGSRSARHVMQRADLLVLEVIVHLTETYHRRACDPSMSGRRTHQGLPWNRAAARMAEQEAA